jgi:hypothetical protein
VTRKFTAIYPDLVPFNSFTVTLATLHILVHLIYTFYNQLSTFVFLRSVA